MKETQRIKELKAMIKEAEKTCPEHFIEFFQYLLDFEKKRIGAGRTNEYIQILKEFLQRRGTEIFDPKRVELD